MKKPFLIPIFLLFFLFDYQSTQAAYHKTFCTADLTVADVEAYVKKPCFGESNGSINIIINNAEIGTSYTVTWSKKSPSSGEIKSIPGWPKTISYGENKEDVFDLEPGLYSVLIVSSLIPRTECPDGKCGKVEMEMEVEENEEIVIPEPEIKAPCFGISSIDFKNKITGGTGPLSYLWSNGGKKEKISVLKGGLYKLTITDYYGCKNYYEHTFNESLSLKEPKVSNGCKGEPGSIIFTQPNSLSGGLEPYNIKWSNGEKTLNVKNLEVGKHILLITDNQGCTITREYTINETREEIIILDPEITHSCSTTNAGIGFSGKILFNGSGVLNGTPPYQYSWDAGTIFIPTASFTSPNISKLSAGRYTLTVRDFFGCKNSKDFFVENRDPKFNTPIIEPSCEEFKNGKIVFGENKAININKTFSYSWVGNNFSNNTLNILNVGGGEYFLRVKDEDNCIYDASFVVPTKDPIIIGNPSIKNGCGEGKSDILFLEKIYGGVPPYTYLWSNGVNTLNNYNLNPGEYYLTVTDIKGCSSYKKVKINPQNNDVRVEFDYKCNNNKISVFPNFGIPPYTYFWDDQSTNSFIEYVINGLDYNVTITDASGCTRIREYKIEFNDTKLAEISEYTHAICTPPNNYTQSIGGTIKLKNLTTEQLEFSWAGPNGFVSHNQDLYGVNSGQYSVTITNGDCQTILNHTVCCCDDNNTCHVGTLAPITLNSQYENSSSNNTNTGNIKLYISGGKGQYITKWTGFYYKEQNGKPQNFESTDKSIFNLYPGIYTVLIKDGCGELKEQFEIGPLDQCHKNPIGSSFNLECLADRNIKINLLPYGGQQPYTFLWDDGTANSSKIINSDPALNYVTIKDNNNCIFEKNLNIDCESLQNINCTNLIIPEFAIENIYGHNAIVYKTGKISMNKIPKYYKDPLGNKRKNENASVEGVNWILSKIDIPGNYCFYFSDIEDCSLPFCIEINMENKAPILEFSKLARVYEPEIYTDFYPENRTFVDEDFNVFKEQIQQAFTASNWSMDSKFDKKYIELGWNGRLPYFIYTPANENAPCSGGQVLSYSFENENMQKIVYKETPFSATAIAELTWQNRNVFDGSLITQKEWIFKVPNKEGYWNPTSICEKGTYCLFNSEDIFPGIKLSYPILLSTCENWIHKCIKNNELDLGELGVDCGGFCPPCNTCKNGGLDNDEDCQDCGGPHCPPCEDCNNCIKDGLETGVDCGGPYCKPCNGVYSAHCFNNVQDYDETGIDCGGINCPPCPEDPCIGITCPVGQICIDGICVGDPCENVVCPPGEICIDGFCVEGNSGCDCPSGLNCVNEECFSDGDLCNFSFYYHKSQSEPLSVTFFVKHDLKKDKVVWIRNKELTNNFPQIGSGLNMSIYQDDVKIFEWWRALQEPKVPGEWPIKFKILKEGVPLKVVIEKYKQGHQSICIFNFECETSFAPDDCSEDNSFKIMISDSGELIDFKSSNEDGTKSLIGNIKSPISLDSLGPVSNLTYTGTLQDITSDGQNNILTMSNKDGELKISNNKQTGENLWSTSLPNDIYKTSFPPSDQGIAILVRSSLDNKHYKVSFDNSGNQLSRTEWGFGVTDLQTDDVKIFLHSETSFSTAVTTTNKTIVKNFENGAIKRQEFDKSFNVKNIDVSGLGYAIIGQAKNTMTAGNKQYYSKPYTSPIVVKTSRSNAIEDVAINDNGVETRLDASVLDGAGNAILGVTTFNEPDAGSDSCSFLTILPLSTCGCTIDSSLLQYDAQQCKLSWTSQCPGYAYTLQKKTNNAWTTVSTAASPYVIPSGGDGSYRLSLVKIGCTTIHSAEVTTTCSGACSCTAPSLVLNSSNCSISWDGASCPGYTMTLQKLEGSTWTNISTQSPYYVTYTNGTYRLEIKKQGCTISYSNTVAPTCGTACNCYAPLLSYNSSNCALTWEAAACAGFTTKLQKMANGSWSTMSNVVSPYKIPYGVSGEYRLIVEKASCQSYYSNTIAETCYTDPCECNLAVLDFDAQTCELTWEENLCSDFDYHLQIKVGYVWQDVANAASPYSIPAGQNSTYRLALTSSTCNDIYSDEVLPVCNPCNCLNLGLGYNSQNCNLSWNTSECQGYLMVLQQKDGNQWLDINGANSPYTMPSNATNTYRLKATSSNCTTIYSEELTKTCVNCTSLLLSYSGILTNSCQNIALSAIGGNEPYLYSWNALGNLTSTQSIASNNVIPSKDEIIGASGSYLVTVTDAQGCSQSTLIQYNRCDCICKTETNYCPSNITYTNGAGTSSYVSGLLPANKHYKIAFYNQSQADQFRMNYISNGIPSEIVLTPYFGSTNSNNCSPFVNTSAIPTQTNVNQIIAQNGGFTNGVNVEQQSPYVWDFTFLTPSIGKIEIIVNEQGCYNGNNSFAISCVSSSSLPFVINEGEMQDKDIIINHRKRESNISIYPNLFTNGFTIDVNAGSSSFTNLLVTNSSGQQIFKDLLPLGESDNRYYLVESETWPAGVYYLSMIAEDGSIITHSKVIKVK